ncbi:hypothetical protein BN1708_013290 [Verticillium longisporum]|uniref:Transcription factor domain-containing protein n=1 Tax=Verticillium longisporum TaxID=100787 RepID=A0A0G4LJ78_VERLO|nr:hypothetical protein BN1708_013290 [Verticillium longisporum]
MAPPLRPILPLSSPCCSVRHEEPCDDVGNSPSPRKRRKTIDVACERCRTKKSACTYRSSKQKVEEYETEIEALQCKLRHHEELVKRLRALPEDEAVESLRCLRSMSDSAGLPSLNPRTPSPSLLAVTQSMAPSTHLNLDSDFDLSSPYLSTCPMQDPLGSSSNIQAALPSSPDLPSFETSITQKHSTTVVSEPPQILPPLANTQIVDVIRDGPHAEAHAMLHCDPRLTDLDVTYWTNVPMSNIFAAAMLTAYIQWYHPFSAMFDENLFLDDLVHHRHQFCSSFLVAAVLLTACQQHAAFDARSLEYIPGLAFECEMSWRSERHQPSSLTLAASQLFASSCTLPGQDLLLKEPLSDENHVAAMSESINYDAWLNILDAAKYRSVGGSPES